jgi:hypothetical protein
MLSISAGPKPFPKRKFRSAAGLQPRRLARPIDPLSDLSKALTAYPAKAIDDDDDESNDDEPLPIEQGFDKSDPGEA